MYVDETFEVIERLEVLRHRPAILETVSRALERFGFTGFVLTGLPPEEDDFTPTVLLNGWPQGWYDRYLEAGHYRHDPCARRCRDTTQPFTWDEIPAALQADPDAARVADEAGEFGFRQGLCVPLHSVYGFRGLSMAGGKIELPPGARRMIHMLSAYACAAAERTARRPTVALSAREREVLRWIAVGKTAEDTGQILGLSFHTIGQHLKNIRRKLDASNNVHAVVEALRTRQISL